MILSILKKITFGKKKRLGRGHGTGKGSHTVGRGTKGARARVGQEVPLWFEGGQLPLVRRLPFMRGKGRNVSLMMKPQHVSLAQIEKHGLKHVTPETLKEKQLIKDSSAPIKILGAGAVSFAVTVERVKVTQSVKRAIEKNGGKVL